VFQRRRRPREKLNVLNSSISALDIAAAFKKQLLYIED
jgi:hypothetical protein